MCSFRSCQTRLEFLSQFRKVRNAFECFVTQVQTHLPKTKRVWPMKINVICTVHLALMICKFDYPGYSFLIISYVSYFNISEISFRIIVIGNCLSCPHMGIPLYRLYLIITIKPGVIMHYFPCT